MQACKHVYFCSAVSVLTQNCNCSLVRVCLSYCARHPSSAAEDLALAALNLLTLTMPASSSPQPGMQQTSPPVVPRTAQQGSPAVATATEFDGLAELEVSPVVACSCPCCEVKGCQEPCSCCDSVDTTLSVLESRKQALDKHHQVDASRFVLHA